MIRKFFSLLVVIIIVPEAFGQSLQEYLQHVSHNNPEIIAYRKMLEARRYEARTGNTPPDPFVSGGIMPGTPDAAGSKKIWSVTQSFAFPTKYLLQKKVNKSTILLAEQEFNQGKMQILLDAELTYFDLIHRMKYLDYLLSRKEGYDRLLSAWKKMLDNGQTTIMDYNRIRMEISAVNLEITGTRADIEMLSERLAYISGGSSAGLLPGDYPLIPEPDRESLLEEKSAVHPSWLIPAMEHEIGLQELKLSKSGSLPEFELGYESEMIPGETYMGPVGGISIPLWSNTNRVKAAAARADHLSAQRDALLQKLGSEVRSEYSNMKALQRSITEMRGILEPGGGREYLDTALDAGEISITTYFTYLEAIYRSEDRLLNLENEFQKSLARLLDHRLIISAETRNP